MSKERKSYKILAGEDCFKEQIILKGPTSNILDIKISGQDTEGQLLVLEQTGINPKGGPPLHIHHGEDEVCYIIEGEYIFQVGDEKLPIKPGDTIFLPRGIQHAFVQLSEKSKMLLTYQPAGKIEAFFKTLASISVPPSPQEVAQIFEAHGMKIVGAPLKVA
jgi:quercetin dioxygenase-like cupin family protein